MCYEIQDFGEEGVSEVETDDENEIGETGEECSSESEVDDENDVSNEEDWASSEAKEDANDEDDNDPKSAATALRNLVPYGLEDFEKVMQMQSLFYASCFICPPLN